MFQEVRDKFDEIVRNDNRQVPGLDNKPTRYLHVHLPLKAVQMLGFLRAQHGDVCSMAQVNEAADLFAFTHPELKLLLEMFKHLGMVLHFPEAPGGDDFVVLEFQWLINAISCLIREEEFHGSLLRDLLADDPSENLQVWHRTPNAVVWNEKDVENGWFSADLLSYIWGHTVKYKKLAATKPQIQFLKNLMTHFNLMQPVTRGHDTFFIVPSLVPTAPKLPAPPLLENSDQLPKMPHSVGWELHRLRQQHGEHVQAFDLMFDFSTENYFPDDLFESLVCAVATNISKEISDKAIRFSVKFYRHEATFVLNEHYIHAIKNPLDMRVYSISSPGNFTTAQYSLRVFRECMNNLVQNRITYSLNLGYVDNECYSYAPYTDEDLATSAVHKIWHGDPDVKNPEKKWKKQVNQSHLSNTCPFLWNTRMHSIQSHEGNLMHQ